MENEVRDGERKKSDCKNTNDDSAKAEVFLGAGSCLSHALGGFFNVGDGPAHARYQALSHFIQSKACAYKHSADSNRPDDKFPDLKHLVSRIIYLGHGLFQGKGCILAHKEGGPCLEIHAR